MNRNPLLSTDWILPFLLGILFGWILGLWQQAAQVASSL